MSRRFALTALAVLFLSLAPLATPAALADDGAPGVPPAAPVRPPDTVLRGVAAAPLAPALPAPPGSAAPKKELVIFVGGYQTCACTEQPMPDYAKRALDAGYEVKTFGQDARFPYDTYGHVDASGRNLRDQIRAVAGDYSAVHVVTHSMGGVVADQAFAQGLSRGDGVVTYTSIAAPHSGSDAARAIGLLELLGPDDTLRRIASLAGFETRSDAVHDLAHLKPVAAPPGVVRLDLRAASDLLVTERDSRDPGVASRILSVRGEGHGAILHDPAAIDLTLRTIAGRRVPPDDRSRALIDAAERASRLVGLAFVAILIACGAYLLYRRLVPGGAVVLDTLGHLLPPPRRRSCP